jgi:hypothetical protein
MIGIASLPQSEYGFAMSTTSDDEIAKTKAAIVRERAINDALVELAQIISEMDDDAPSAPQRAPHSSAPSQPVASDTALLLHPAPDHPATLPFPHQDTVTAFVVECWAPCGLDGDPDQRATDRRRIGRPPLGRAFRSAV